MRTVRHICGTCWRVDKKQLKHLNLHQLARTKCDYPVAFQMLCQCQLRSLAPQNLAFVRLCCCHPIIQIVIQFFKIRITANSFPQFKIVKTVADTIATYPESTGIAHVIYDNIETSDTKSTFYSDEHYISIHNEICRSGMYNFEGCRFPLQTHLKIDYWRFMLSDYPDKNLCEFLEIDFPIGYFGKQLKQNHSVKNHKGAKEFPMHVQSFLNKEKKYGATLGLFKENPFSNVITLSPLNTVPKKDSEDRRIILDLSFPKGSSINDKVSKDFYLGDKINLTYPGVDDLVNIVKIKGKGCLLFKCDLKRAYRQIPIDPGDASLVGNCFNGNLYFDKVLTFGLRSAAFLCQRLTSAVRYICQMLSILIVNYLDDLAGADFKDTAWRTYRELRKVLEFCGLEESVEKTCQPSTQMYLLVFCLTPKI